MKNRVAWNKGLTGRTYEDMYGSLRAKLIREKIRVKSLRKHQKSWEVRLCVVCGGEFEVRKSSTNITCSKECRYKKSSGMVTGRHRSVETKIKIGKKSKGRKAWNAGLTKLDSPLIVLGTEKMLKTRMVRDNYKGRNKGRVRSLKERRKLKVSGKRLWQDPEYRLRHFLGQHRSPNHLELKFSRWLGEWGFNQIEFTGDKKFWLGIPKSLREVLKFKKYAVNPDYVVRPFRKSKKVIELLGKYWHKKDEVNERKTIYDSLGISYLFVWDYELRRKAAIRDKITCFVR